METKLTEGDCVESIDFYNDTFKTPILKSKIIFITPHFFKKNKFQGEYFEYVATLDSGKEISTSWLKRVI